MKKLISRAGKKTLIGVLVLLIATGLVVLSRLMEGNGLSHALPESIAGPINEAKSQANDYENEENNMSLSEWMAVNEECRALLKADSRQFPVVQSGDNETYLNQSIYMQRDIYGVPFFDYRNDIKEDGNLIIYGHSTRNRSLLFTFIRNYFDEEYYKENPGVVLELENGEHLFAVIGIAEVSANAEISQVFLKTSFESKKEKVEWARECYSLLDVKYSSRISPENRFLSLITCNFDATDNRYVLLLQEVDIG